MTSRRGFIAQLAALVAAGTAAPAILAQMRPSSRAPLPAAESLATWPTTYVLTDATCHVMEKGTVTSLGDGVFRLSEAKPLPPGVYRYHF